MVSSLILCGITSFQHFLSSCREHWWFTSYGIYMPLAWREGFCFLCVFVCIIFDSFMTMSFRGCSLPGSATDPRVHSRKSTWAGNWPLIVIIRLRGRGCPGREWWSEGRYYHWKMCVNVSPVQFSSAQWDLWTSFYSDQKFLSLPSPFQSWHIWLSLLNLNMVPRATSFEEMSMT